MTYSNFSRILVAAFLLAFPLASAYGLSGKEQEKEGATLFRDKGCAYCHGATLAGTAKGPSLEQVRKRLKPAQIEDQIKNGGQRMPAFEDSTNADQLAALVAYLRAKRRPEPAASESRPPVINPGQ